MPTTPPLPLPHSKCETEGLSSFPASPTTQPPLPRIWSETEGLPTTTNESQSTRWWFFGPHRHSRPTTPPTSHEDSLGVCLFLSRRPGHTKTGPSVSNRCVWALKVSFFLRFVDFFSLFSSTLLFCINIQYICICILHLNSKN
jgi:hypothetical protein